VRRSDGGGRARARGQSVALQTREDLCGPDPVAEVRRADRDDGEQREENGEVGACGPEKQQRVGDERGRGQIHREQRDADDGCGRAEREPGHVRLYEAGRQTRCVVGSPRLRNSRLPTRAAGRKSRNSSAAKRLHMDARVREHAEIIADHSTDIQSGDDVVIQMPKEAEDLAVALHEICGDRGANPVYLNYSKRAQRAFKRSSDDFTEPSHRRALYEEADVFIIARGGSNATEDADIDPETNAAYNRAMEDVKRTRLSKTWCLTQYPTASHAQLAGMSTEAYENFVWDAVSLDWDEQREFQSNMVEILDTADEVRITSGEETDLTMDLSGNSTLNDYGEANLPGGEVFTAPVRDGVDGEVHFDLPLYRYGREIEGSGSGSRTERSSPTPPNATRTC